MNALDEIPDDFEIQPSNKMNQYKKKLSKIFTNKISILKAIKDKFFDKRDEDLEEKIRQRAIIDPFTTPNGDEQLNPNIIRSNFFLRIIENMVLEPGRLDPIALHMYVPSAQTPGPPPITSDEWHEEFQRITLRYRPVVYENDGQGTIRRNTDVFRLIHHDPRSRNDGSPVKRIKLVN